MCVCVGRRKLGLYSTALTRTDKADASSIDQSHFDVSPLTATSSPSLAILIGDVYWGATENARHENASKIKQTRRPIRKNMFIIDRRRCTASAPLQIVQKEQEKRTKKT